MTAWIDGSSIYGSSSSWCDALRSFHKGLLSVGSSHNMPKQSDSDNFMWSAPDPSTGQTGPVGLYGKSKIQNCRIHKVSVGCWSFKEGKLIVGLRHKSSQQFSDNVDLKYRSIKMEFSLLTDRLIILMKVCIQTCPQLYLPRETLSIQGRKKACVVMTGPMTGPSFKAMK